MHNKLILLLSILYLLPSPLAFSETEVSFNYVTPAIDNNPSHSYNYSEFFDEELFPYQVNNIDPNINHDKMDVIAKNNNSLNCDGACVILSKMVIPLNDIFHTSDIDVERQNKVALFSFEIDSNSTFNLNLENNADITIDDNEIHILSSGIDSQQISHPLHPDTTSISFIFEMSNSELKINYMESNQHQKGTPSATITLHSERTRNLNTLPNLVIYNNVLNGPLIMSHHLMVRMSGDHRIKRGTAGIIGCLLSGPLALYNVVVHGRCNQVESAWASIKSFFSGEDKAKMQLVAGSATALKPKPLTEKPANTWVLTQLDLPSLHQQSLTLPAVANICHIPLDNLISSRFPRQVGGPACGSWLSRLLADFTLLFGGSLRDWSMEHLRRVVDSAIDSDNTGYAVIDTATERRLLQGIRRGVRELGRIEAINQITGSFHYAESALAHYYLRTHGENTTPSAAQNLPLGHYVLSLDSYIPSTEPVRIRRNGEWETSNTLAFQVEIISGEDQQRELHAASLDVINDWYEKYYSLSYGAMLIQDEQTHKETRIPITASDRIIYAARITSDSLKTHLENKTPGFLFVIVKVDDEIIHMLEAVKYTINDEEQEGHYYLANFLTKPQFIIDTDAEGSIRGAGTAAVHGLASYLKRKGVKYIHSDAISHPSARVKAKLGFKHDEL
ncbi:acetyltransferase domain-containing protein [Yersinia frederiksenii]|nr:acetyltransferase domain-containing protein [Yersinia frederiksenii]